MKGIKTLKNHLRPFNDILLLVERKELIKCLLSIIYDGSEAKKMNSSGGEKGRKLLIIVIACTHIYFVVSCSFPLHKF